jgi:hypothetical protein
MPRNLGQDAGDSARGVFADEFGKCLFGVVALQEFCDFNRFGWLLNTASVVAT